MNISKMQSQASDISELLQACSHSSRLMLLCQLSQEELNVGELEAKLGLQQPSLSQHLGVLRRQGLIEGRRAGQQIYYKLVDDRAKALVTSLYTIFCEK
ncbi:MAG: helix-turn-helix transcriptional regulator [Pseudomonadaceae bacterium]|nr:helix-turn-helix transcriptional regulator [Pseudomonadaceae bacterium]